METHFIILFTFCYSRDSIIWINSESIGTESSSSSANRMHYFFNFTDCKTRFQTDKLSKYVLIIILICKIPFHPLYRNRLNWSLEKSRGSNQGFDSIWSISTKFYLDSVSIYIKRYDIEINRIIIIIIIIKFDQIRQNVIKSDNIVWFDRDKIGIKFHQISSDLMRILSRS